MHKQANKLVSKQELQKVVSGERRDSVNIHKVAWTDDAYNFDYNAKSK